MLDATIAQNIEEQFERHELTLHVLNEEELQKLFLSMASLHMDYQTACTRGHETQYAVITKQLKARIHQLLEQHMDETAAVLYSAMLVEAYEDLQRNRHLTPEKYYEKIKPFLLNGLKQFME